MNELSRKYIGHGGRWQQDMQPGTRFYFLICSLSKSSEREQGRPKQALLWCDALDVEGDEVHRRNKSHLALNGRGGSRLEG